MEYVKKRSILFVAILVLSMVLGSISIVSAASRTQDVYKSYDVSVKSGSSAYGYTDGNKWSAVYEKVLGTNGTTLTPIWYSADGSNYYPVEVSRVYQSGGYVYTFKANGAVLYTGQNAVMNPAIIAKLYDKKLTKTIYSGTETVSNQTFNGPVEVEAGANITFDNVKFNNGLTTYGVSNVSNSSFTDSTAVNRGSGKTYIADTYFGHTASSSSFYGQTSSVVGVKLKSNRLSDAVKGKAYAELLSFPDFSYTYYPNSYSARVTAKMHYDTVSIVGALPGGLTASAANYDATAEKTDVNITGTPTAEGIDQLFDINFTEGVSKLNITIPMLINVNAYSVEYNVIGDTPNGYAVPSTVTGVGYGETVTLEAAPNSVSGQKNGVNGTWEFSGWSTDRNNISTTKVTTVNVTQNTVVYGQWIFKADNTSSTTVTPASGNSSRNSAPAANTVGKHKVHRHGPKTGDSNDIGGYLLVLGVASAMLAVVSKRKAN